MIQTHFFIVEQLFIEDVKQVVGPYLQEKGVELVDLLISRGRNRSILRFLVERPEGITLGECATLNKEVGRLLEQQDLIQQSYVLEVSSPGLDRPFKNTRDFQRNLGQLVKFVLHRPVNKQNVWIAILDAADEDNVTIHTEAGEKLQIARQDLAWAKLEVEA